MMIMLIMLRLLRPLLLLFLLLVLHHASDLRVGGEAEVLGGLPILGLHDVVLVRSRTQGAPGDADLVALVHWAGHGGVLLLLLLAALLPLPEHEAVREHGGRAPGGGLQSKGALVQGRARPDRARTLQGAETVSLLREKFILLCC